MLNVIRGEMIMFIKWNRERLINTVRYTSPYKTPKDFLEQVADYLLNKESTLIIPCRIEYGMYYTIRCSVGPLIETHKPKFEGWLFPDNDVRLCIKDFDDYVKSILIKLDKKYNPYNRLI